jgi:hypothetical protein
VSTSKRDFVQENILDAGIHQKKDISSRPDGSEFLKKADYGRVPTYLHARNMELAATYAKRQVVALPSFPAYHFPTQ